MSTEDPLNPLCGGPPLPPVVARDAVGSSESRRRPLPGGFSNTNSRFVFSKKRGLDTTITSWGPKNRIPRQMLPIYSNYEVYRSKSISKYLNFNCLISCLFIGSLGQYVSIHVCHAFLWVCDLQQRCKGNRKAFQHSHKHVPTTVPNSSPKPQTHVPQSCPNILQQCPQNPPQSSSTHPRKSNKSIFCHGSCMISESDVLRRCS